jgi:four helix bundle protein
VPVGGEDREKIRDKLEVRSQKLEKKLEGRREEEKERNWHGACTWIAVTMAKPEPIHERSFRFALDILRFYRILASTTDVPRHLSTQMVRSGTAIGANLEEGKSAYSRRDLAAKYAIGLREGRECHYWLRLIRVDQPQLSKHIDSLLDECNQLIAVLTTIVRKLRIERIGRAATVAGVVVISSFVLSHLLSNFWLLTSNLS